MNTLDITIEGFAKQHIEFPSEWNELTADQLKAIAVLLHSQERMPDFRVKAVHAMIGSKNELFRQYGLILKAQDKAIKQANLVAMRYWQARRDALNEAIYSISETLRFTFEKITLTKQLLPRVKGFFAPSTGFGNVSFVEFANAETAYKSWANTSEDVYLNRLIAVLYRPNLRFWRIRSFFSIDFDPRRPYTDAMAAAMLSKVARWPMDVKYSILAWFSGCYNYIIEKYPHVFREGEGEGDGFGWAGTITQLAGTKFGDVEATASENLHTILRHLEIEMRNYERQKKEMENLKNRNHDDN